MIFKRAQRSKTTILMSTLLFLGTDDFFVHNGALCTELSGFSMLFFYSSQCQHCQKFGPLFQELPKQVMRCSFGMINVGKNKRIVNVAQNTSTPITFVPLIIMYVNGVPFAQYSGEYTQASIQRFIYTMSTRAREENFPPQGSAKREVRGVNDSTYDSLVSYLEFGEAYIDS